MLLETIYKATNGGKIQEWTIEVVENKYRTISGQTDGKKVVSEWTEVYGKNEGKANATTDNEQALKEAEAKRKLKLERGYFENIKNINKKQYFEPMLACKYEDYKDKLVYPIYSQPKLDGIRCIVTKDGMFSRNGKEIISAPHIRESLDKLFKYEPDLILDGELYADKFANDFNKIVSLVKKTKPTAEDLKESAKNIEYHIYDVPSVDESFTGRWRELDELALDFPNCVKQVETHIVKNEGEVTEWYENYVERGYEGQMLRTDGKYENKRSKFLLKHKSFIDEEYTILGIEEGQGNKTGMVGSFIFENKDGKRFNASPKFNWQACKQMWNERETLIGKQATVKYFNLTPGDSPVPRFPYVTAIRDYE